MHEKLERKGKKNRLVKKTKNYTIMVNKFKSTP